MRILLYGSTKLAERVSEALQAAYHEVVATIPCRDEPTVPGRMTGLIYDPDSDLFPDHDLKLSVQYDRRLEPDGRTFNIHTGLLPGWGGCDILHHTLTRGGVHEQGLTCHLVTDTLDGGPIIATTAYPVLPGDTVLDLYARQLAVAGPFVLGCLRLIQLLGDAVADCHTYPPVIYRRGRISPLESELYAENKRRLRERFP